LTGLFSSVSPVGFLWFPNFEKKKPPLFIFYLSPTLYFKNGPRLVHKKPPFFFFIWNPTGFPPSVPPPRGGKMLFFFLFFFFLGPKFCGFLWVVRNFFGDTFGNFSVVPFFFWFFGGGFLPLPLVPPFTPKFFLGVLSRGVILGVKKQKKKPHFSLGFFTFWVVFYLVHFPPPPPPPL